MASGMVAVTERSEVGGPCLDTENDERVAHIQPAVGIVLGESPIEEPGTLYVTTKRLVWLSDEDVHKGYAVDFYSLSMHAISRDVEAYPQPCIYTQIENGNETEEEFEEDEDAQEPLEPEINDTPSDLSHVTEMRLVPKDSSVQIVLKPTVDHLFQVLCDCAVLNPDPEVEQEGEGEWFFNKDEVMANVIGANGTNDHGDLAELLHHDPRFEDAEEEDE